MFAFHESLAAKKGYTPTPDDIAVAKGEKPLSAEHLASISTPTNTIQTAFARQQESKMVS